MFPAGIEPATLRVWGARDNHYTTETRISHVITQMCIINSPVDEWDLPKEPRHDGPVVHPGVHRGEVKADADAERAHHDEEAAPVLSPQLHSWRKRGRFCQVGWLWKCLIVTDGAI